MFAVEDRLADYEQWRDERAPVVATARVPASGSRPRPPGPPRRPSRDRRGDAGDAEADRESSQIPGAENRPRGPRFGTLVHAVLATVPLDAADDRRAHGAHAGADHQRAGGRSRAPPPSSCPPCSGTTSSRAPARLVVHQARNAGVVAAEGRHADRRGSRSGVRRRPAATVVVDFKTDYELAAGEARYRAQLAAVCPRRGASHRPAVSGVLFRV